VLIMWNRGNAPRHVARNFHLGEFECRCGACELQYIDSNLLEMLDDLRELIKAPIMIIEGFRCSAYNKTIQGSSKSRHVRGMAADIRVPKYSLEELEKLAGRYFGRIGVANTFLHVDVDDGEANWKISRGD
jgi:uncharacterized protein YcbK (DUF882 family)